MTSFAPIIKQLMTDGIMNIRALPKFSPKGILLLLFSAVWAVLGSGFLLYAGYLYLQARYAPDMAALIIAAAAMCISALIAFAGIHMMKRHPASHHRHAHGTDMAQTVSQLIDTISEELEDPIRDNPKTALMVAGLAGFLAGNQAH